MLLLLSGAGTAAVYATAYLVLQRRESHAKGEVIAVVTVFVVIEIVAVARVTIGIEDASVRTIAIAATPAEPRRRRIYERHAIAIPLSCVAIIGTITGLMEGLTTTGSESAAIYISNIIRVDVW